MYMIIFTNQIVFWLLGASRRSRYHSCRADSWDKLLISLLIELSAIQRLGNRIIRALESDRILILQKVCHLKWKKIRALEGATFHMKGSADNIICIVCKAYSPTEAYYAEFFQYTRIIFVVQ
jgi:hypothetical protein